MEVRGECRSGLRTLLALVTVALVTVALVPARALAAVGFPDVTGGEWYAEAVTWAHDNGVMNGYQDGTFGPGDPLLREQEASVLYNYLADGAEAKQCNLRDVTQSEWYAGPVNWAVGSGTMLGYSGRGTFGVGDPLTREQLAVVMARVCGADLSMVSTTRYSALRDHTSTSSWARESVAWAVEHSVINGFDNGDGTRTLAPQGTVTRAQMAAVIMNAVTGNLLQQGEAGVDSYTVRFVSGGSDTEHVISLRRYKEGDEVVAPFDPKLPGFEFVGWNTRADGSGRSYEDGVKVEDLTGSERSITLYAQWREVQTVPLSRAYVTLYDDGEVVFDDDASTDSGRAVLLHSGCLDDWSASFYTSGSDLRSRPTRISSRCDIRVDTNSLSRAFANWINLTDISGLRRWDVSGVSDLSDMFFNCERLSDISPLSGWELTGANKLLGMLMATDIRDTEALKGWDTRTVTDMSWLFAGCEQLESVDGIGGWSVSSVKDIAGILSGCSALRDIGSLEAWGAATGQVTDMHASFYGCRSLATVEPIARWNISKVTTLVQTFADCGSVDFSPLSAWDVSGVTQMDEIFYGSNGTLPSWYRS